MSLRSSVGCGKIVVHGTERVGPRELLPVVCRGVRGQRRPSASTQRGLQGAPSSKPAWTTFRRDTWSTKEVIAMVEVIQLSCLLNPQRCDHCGQSGATVGCCLTTCQSNFHFMCARVQHCVFQQDRKVYCYKHRDLVSDKVYIYKKNKTISPQPMRFVVTS